MSSTLSSPQKEAKDYQPRYKVLYFVITLSVTILLLRLWYLQVISGHELREYSEKNRVKESLIQAPRGLILDREGRVLVENVPVYAAVISPQYATKLKETAEVIAPVLGMSSNEIVSMVQKGRRSYGSFRDVFIKEDLTQGEIFKVRQLRLDHPGLDITQVISRHYPLGENGAQLFGYVGEISKSQIEQYNRRHKGQIHFRQGDIIGKRGIEEAWDHKIRGRDGVQFVEVDARGRKTYGSKKVPFSFSFQAQEAISGNHLVLTIDKDLQEVSYRALDRNDKVGRRKGSVVVMKSNGEILSWVVRPSFDSNQLSNGISQLLWSQLISSPFKPLRNKVIQEHYPPGSAFKPFVALAALQEGVISKNTRVFSPGYVLYLGRRYHDSKRSGHGELNIIEAIERSSNTFFYKLGMSLGVDNIAKYGKRFGFGEKTNINLSGEVQGLMPTKAWKRQTKGESWQPGEDLSVSIGQGYVLTTVIQLAQGIGTVALEGKRYQPFLVKKIIDPSSQDDEEVFVNHPKIIDDLTKPDENGLYIKKEHFKTVKEGMKRVFSGERGTARWYRIKGLDMAGKTGTVQLMSFSVGEVYKKCLEMPLRRRHHGWFVGFAPVDDPEIIVVVFAEHGCSGSSGAAPIFRDIVRAYFDKHQPKAIKKDDVLKEKVGL